VEQCSVPPEQGESWWPADGIIHGAGAAWVVIVLHATTSGNLPIVSRLSVIAYCEPRTVWDN
jgi:hypothetical protein